MKKIKNAIILILIGIILLTLTGCSNNEIVPNGNEDEGVTAEQNLEAAIKFEVEQDLFDVEITVPSEMLADQTQEELNSIAAENGYKSITLNEDGSATYVMTKSQHIKMMEQMYYAYSQVLNDLVGSEEYPNFTEIKFNDNFTDFTIKTTSEQLDLNESMSVLAFYMYGAIYSMYSGTEIDNVHVKYINDATGEVILESNSKDMANAQ